MVLGPIMGWRYWVIGRKCVADPTLARRWKVNCENEARFCLLRGDSEGASLFSEWASELEKCAPFNQTSTR